METNIMGHTVANVNAKKSKPNFAQRVVNEFKREVGAVKDAFNTGETSTTRERSTLNTQDVYSPTPKDQLSDHYQDQDNWLKATRQFK